MRMSWEYIAGFFDGEGNICTVHFARRGGTFSTVVSMSQTQQRGFDLLTEIKVFLKGEGVHSTIGIRRKPNNAKWKDCWALRVYGRESVMVFLKQVIPFVRIKKVEACDAWRFHSMYPAVNGILAAERAKDRGAASMAALDSDAIRSDFSSGMSRGALAKKYSTTFRMICRCVDPTYMQRCADTKARSLARKAARQAA